MPAPDRYRRLFEVTLGLSPLGGVRVNTPRPISADDTTVVFEVWPDPNVVIELSPLPLPPTESTWEGFTLGLYGTFADPDGKPAHGPSLSFQDHRGNFRVVSLWRQWARHEDSPLITEQLWLPGYPELCSIRGIEHDHSRNQLLAAEAGLALLRGIEDQIKGGMSDREALAEAVALGKEWRTRNPDSEPKDFGRDQLAEMKFILRGSLDVWMKRKHFTIRMVQMRL